MSENQDVVVTGRMEHGIAVRIGRHPERAGRIGQRIEVLRREVVAVKIDDHVGCLMLRYPLPAHR